MNMSFFNGLKSFFILVIYLSLLTSSEKLIIKKFIKKLCEVSEYPVPTNPSECSSLFERIVFRYYPKQSSKNVKDAILKELVLDATDNDESKQWNMIFEYIEAEFTEVEALLTAIELKQIPTNEEKWERVKIFTNKLIEDIQDIQDVQNNLQKQNMKEIRSILGTKFSTSNDYLKAFRKLAFICDVLLPSKGVVFIRNVLGFINDPGFNALISNSTYRSLIEAVGKKFLEAVKACRLYGCAFKIRQFIETFIPKNYAGAGDKKVIDGIIADFVKEESDRHTNLNNYFRHIVSLTAKLGDYNIECIFKKKWENLWTKQLEIDVQKPTDKEKAESLEEAILRIWKAQDAEEAVKLWKADKSLWSEKGDMISNEDNLVIKKLAKLTRNRKLIMKLSTSAPVSVEDREFAITLQENDLKDKEKYRQCVWILTYSTEEYIKKLKEEFNGISPNPDYITKNHQFCRILYDVWTLTSIYTFHGKDTKGLPPVCEPTVADYEMYVSSLGVDPKNEEMKDFIRIILNLGPRSTTKEELPENLGTQNSNALIPSE